jgi:protein-L-isoaspartate(D-aspartate) O-methyltransferase
MNGQLSRLHFRLRVQGTVMNLTGQKEFIAAAQRKMLREQLADFPPRIVEAMARVPRHEFIPADKREFAYADSPVPIGFGQTISQPWIVAMMTAQLNPRPGSRVLELGTGCGYQAAVLAQLVAEVFTIEIIEPLALAASENFQRLQIRNICLRCGDGTDGWPEAAPFDGIIVTCAPLHVPQALAGQLKEGGRLLIPVGVPSDQELFVFEKQQGQLAELARLPVRFVPMTGKANLFE